jgi:hypothetical protein
VMACAAMVITGNSIVSSAVKLTVTTLPVLANVVLGLSEMIVTAVREGATLSNSTLLLLVVAATLVPVLPVISLNTILKGTVPSASEPVMV